MIFIGIIIIIATVYLLVKQYEVRMVLCVSGFLMAILAGKFLAGFDAFSKNMVLASTIQTICSVMGFAFVMKVTECDKHLIHAMAKVVVRLKALMIPISVIATFGVNIALPSAAGTAAAVGAIFIPILVSAGIHPAIAASCILTGLWGSLFNPGNAHNPFISNIAKIPVPEIIAHNAMGIVATMLVATAMLTLVAFFMKEHKGYAVENGAQDSSAPFKVNFLYALAPLVPLGILLVSSMKLIEGVKVGVPQAMLIGCIVAVALTRTNPATVSKAFFEGMGSAYAGIVGIIISSGVFVAGMTAIGIVDAFVDLMVNSTGIVRIAAAFGPYLLGLFAGSGDAAAFAFNGAISPQAAKFGLEIADMGAVAALCGSFGHKMSPIAGSTIIVAGLACVNPFEISKRMFPGTLCATVTAMVLFLY